MKGSLSINSDLLRRAEKFARENALSVSAVIEEALCNYLGPQARTSSSRIGEFAELPVATSLKMAGREVCDMSFGKLIGLSEEGISLDKAR
jgi:hypothetical protein